MLQRRNHSQSRLRALVLVHPVGKKSVESAARLRVPHDLPRIVGTLEPGCSGRDTIGPGRSGVDGGRTRARIGQRGHLDRLLVESRPGVVGPSACHRSRRQVAVGRFVVDQPAQEIQATLLQRRVVKRNARGFLGNAFPFGIEDKDGRGNPALVIDIVYTPRFVSVVRVSASFLNLFDSSPAVYGNFSGLPLPNY